MPTQQQVTTFFNWIWKAFPTIVLVGGFVVGNYLYRFQDTFKRELLNEINESFVTRSEAAANMERFTKRDAFDIYKAKTDSAIYQLSTEFRINQATMNGVITRIDENIREMREDLKEVKSKL
jgi:hypothetical protein